MSGEGRRRSCRLQRAGLASDSGCSVDGGVRTALDRADHVAAAELRRAVQKPRDERRGFLRQKIDHAAREDDLQDDAHIVDQTRRLRQLVDEALDERHAHRTDKADDTELDREIEHRADALFRKEGKLAHHAEGEQGNRQERHREELDLRHEDFKRDHEEAVGQDDECGNDDEHQAQAVEMQVAVDARCRRNRHGDDLVARLPERQRASSRLLAEHLEALS